MDVDKSIKDTVDLLVETGMSREVALDKAMKYIKAKKDPVNLKEVFTKRINNLSLAQATSEIAGRAKHLNVEYERPKTIDGGRFSYLPTLFTRINPFWIMSNTEKTTTLETWPLNTCEIKNKWGEIIFTTDKDQEKTLLNEKIKNGKLAVHPDLTILLHLLEMASIQQNFTIETTRSEICRFLGVKHPNSVDLERVENTLIRLASTPFVLQETSKDSNKEYVNTSVGSLIWVHTKKLTEYKDTPRNGTNKQRVSNKLIIIINNFFVEAFKNCRKTYIDMQLWGKLNDSSKLMYAFYQGQKKKKCTYPLSLLVSLLEKKKINPPYGPYRRKMKAILKNLEKYGFLNKFEIKKDQVIVWKK